MSSSTPDPTEQTATVDARSIRSFAEFYPFYLAEHSHRTCRRLHFIGSTLVLVCVGMLLATGRMQYLLYALLCGYGFAWIGHFGFEKNKPASFKRPLYSLMGDWVMYRDMWLGRLLFLSAVVDSPHMTDPAAPTDERIVHIERLVDAIDLPIGRWDAQHRLNFLNGPYAVWAGRPRDQLLGRTLTELYGECAWQAAEAAFAQAFEGRTVCYERLLTHRDGGARWARVQVFPDRDGGGRVDAVYTIAFDIHEDVLARQRLEAARLRVDRFTENIPYPLTYVDRNCVLRFVNKAYTDATGMQAADVLGRHIGEVRGPQLWAEHRPWFERALAGETVQYTRLAQLATLGPRWIRTSYTPDFGDDGGVAGLYTVTTDVHELTVAQQQLQRSLERCPVTDAYSRRAVMDRIEAALPAHVDAPMALFFVDLDGFKAVNDTLGHREGDRLLIAAAVALQAAVRAEDTVGRLGGDEFLVFARVRGETGAHALAQHLLEAIRRSDGGLPRSHRVTASIGYALAPGDSQTAQKLVQRADEAMYAAKRLGRDRVLHCAAVARAAPG